MAGSSAAFPRSGAKPGRFRYPFALSGAFVPKTGNPSMFFDLALWRFTRGLRGRIGFAIVLGILASAAGIVRLALLGWLLARIFAGASPEALLGPFLVVGAAMLARGGLEHWRNMVAHRTAAAVQLRLRAALYDQVVSLGPAYFGLERTGDVLTSLVDGVEQLETYFGQYLPQVVVATLTPLLVFAGVAALDAPVALVMLGFAFFTLLAPGAFSKWDSANSRRRQQAYARFASEFLDTLQGLATLKAFGQSARRGEMLAARAHELFRSTMWVLATNALGRGITDSGLAVGAAAVLGYGAYRVESGEMPLTALLVIVMMGIEVFRPQRDLRALLHQGMVGQAAARGINHLIAARPIVPPVASRQDGRRQDDPVRLEPSIRFENVHFRYPGARRETHRGLDLEVRAGERVGIVGTSGAGKTSMARLLLRLYDPDEGRVLVGGRDLRGVPPEVLYRHIAVVNQDTYLFHGTVAENILFGRPGADREALVAAARAANAHDFIAALPNGYDTVIGERGLRLSGGQRQRIAIARALLRDAPILILDEALSSVDAGNEAVIQDALDRLMEGRTTLVFAHRLSSVIGSERILVLDGGRVVENGPHHSLMAARGTYFRLMRHQAEEGTSGGDFDSVIGDVAETPRPDGTPLSGKGPPGDEEEGIVRARGMGWWDAFRTLLGHVQPWRGKLTATFVFGVVRVVALIGVGVLGALTVAALKRGEPFEVYLVWLAFLPPTAGILHWLESWFAHDMAFRMLAEIRIALYRKFDQLAPAYLLRRRSGDLVSVATHDVELVEYFFAHTIAPTFVAVLVPGAVITTLAYHGWTLAAALAPLLAAVVLSPFLMRHRLDVLGSRAQEALGDLNAHAVDSVQGLAEVIAFQQAPARKQAFLERAERHARLRLAFFRDLTLQTVVIEIATGLGGLAIVTAGVPLVRAGQLDAAVLPLLSILAMAAFLPVSEIAHIGRQLADTLGATRRLYAIHHEPVPVRDGAGVASPSHQGGSALDMSEVTFTYAGRSEPALREVTFSVPAGATVALVGPSGAGKSTTAHLFLRFFDPDRGTVRLDGHPLPEFRLDALRARTALVSQDTYLFNETLRENILLARPEVSSGALERAVVLASLDEFVRSLPEGLDTPVGERGVRLSGGQRQRVAIARAVLKDAAVLVLDEATSHLDAVNEQVVREALGRLMHERTTIVIAHRLSTVRNADLIVVMNAGRIVQIGTHDALLRAGGLYANLVGRQIASAALIA